MRDNVKQAKWTNAHYRRYRDYYIAVKNARRVLIIEALQAFKATLACSLCSESEPCTLDFHHLGDGKEENVSVLAYHSTWSRVIKEIEKCVVLCANCHRRVHKLPEWAAKLDGVKLIAVPPEFNNQVIVSPILQGRICRRKDWAPPTPVA